MLITIAFNLIDIVILQLGAIIFGVALHFFLVSRKNLKQALAPAKKSFSPQQGALKETPKQRPLFSFPTQLQTTPPKRKTVEENVSYPSSFTKRSNSKDESIDSFKESVLQQQRSLNSFLHNMESLQSEENNQLQKQINKLNVLLEKKESELESAKEQAAIAQKMAARIDEVYKEFDWLQSKLAGLEKQAKEATNLAIELEDARQAYAQLEKDIVRKQEKLEYTVSENQRLHQQLSETEDKLTEANLQRQQLIKKMQSLQDMNSDMQNITDTNKKLQTELRRIGELESMLTMMQEERSQLLKRPFK